MEWMKSDDLQAEQTQQNMKIKKAKKLASNLMDEAACKKRYGEEIANALLRLIGKLTEIVDARQLFDLPGRFHRLRYLPADNIYAVTLKHPFRCVMRLDVATSTIILEDVCDYHGRYQKLFRK